MVVALDDLRQISERPLCHGRPCRALEQQERRCRDNKHAAVLFKNDYARRLGACMYVCMYVCVCSVVCVCVCVSV